MILILFYNYDADIISSITSSSYHDFSSVGLRLGLQTFILSKTVKYCNQLTNNGKKKYFWI